MYDFDYTQSSYGCIDYLVMDAFGEGESACNYVGYLVMDAFGDGESAAISNHPVA